MALDVQKHHPHPLRSDHVNRRTSINGGHESTQQHGLVHPPIPPTLQLFHTNHSSSSMRRNQSCQSIHNLKLKSGVQKRHLEDTTMSGNGPKLELKLNLSPPRSNLRVDSPSRSGSVTPTSPPSSCVSTELNQDEALRYSNSPEATSMTLVGCPRCLMYVMLTVEDPRCPQCKSTVLLDILHENTAAKKTKKS